MFQDYFPDDALYQAYPSDELARAPERLVLHEQDLSGLDVARLSGVANLLVSNLPSGWWARVPAMPSLRTLDVESCAIDDLEFLSRFPGLTALRLANLDIDSLDGVEASPSLAFLLLTHLVKVHRLDALAALSSLRELIVATNPGWDGNKRWELHSLAPLSALTSLRRVALAGISLAQDGLTPLWRLTGLDEVDISDSTRAFSLEDYAHLQAALPQTRCPGPDWKYSWPNLCRKCRQEVLVMLRGLPPRARKNACPVCDRARLDAHRAAFRAAMETFAST